jgi:SAM-dependent methyltransferase
MTVKPEFLSGDNPFAWDDAEVASLYRHRLEYPSAVFPVLAKLVVGPRVVLDAGAGTGAIARHLAPLVERVDAVDVALPMLDEGRRLPGGDDARIRWILGAAETAAVDGPYGLIVTSQSLHWMEWSVVLPRFAGLLAPGARLAIVDDPELPAPWSGELRSIIARYSIMRTFQHQFSLIAELERLGLFVREGEQLFDAATTVQPTEEYIASFHARSSLARRRIGTEAAEAFDREVRALLGGRATVERRIGGRLVYGRPVAR